MSLLLYQRRKKDKSLIRIKGQSGNVRIHSRMLRSLLCLAVAAMAASYGVTVSRARLDWLREAEKKHGRVALVALPVLASIASSTGEDPVPWLNSQPAATQLVFYSSAGLLETLNLKRFDKGFTLKAGEVPGKVIPFLNASERIHAIEDLSGRAAMLVATSMLLSSV